MLGHETVATYIWFADFIVVIDFLVEKEMNCSFCDLFVFFLFGFFNFH